MWFSYIVSRTKDNERMWFSHSLGEKINTLLKICCLFQSTLLYIQTIFVFLTLLKLILIIP